MFTNSFVLFLMHSSYLLRARLSFIQKFKNTNSKVRDTFSCFFFLPFLRFATDPLYLFQSSLPETFLATQTNP